MAGKDRVIDPVTGAYVVDDDGQYVYTEDARTMAYHQINTPYNSWPGDFEAGRKQNPTNTGPRDLADIRQSYLACLQRLVDEGVAAEPTVRVSASADGVPGRVLVETTIDDRQAGSIDITNLSRLTE